MNESAEKKMSRRKVLAFAGLGAAAFTTARVANKVSAHLREPRTARLAMVVDLRRCTGCHACSVSCKSEFEVPLGVYRSWVKIGEEGTYPQVKRSILPRLCNQCDNPPCVKVCPVNATYIHATGVVAIQENVCIGCKACISACPYNARFFNPVKRTADKCDFCLHRVENGVVPSCVNGCPAEARMIGDLNDPQSTVSRIIAKQATIVLRPELGTRPHVFYLPA